MLIDGSNNTIVADGISSLQYFLRNENIVRIESSSRPKCL